MTQILVALHLYLASRISRTQTDVLAISVCFCYATLVSGLKANVEHVVHHMHSGCGFPNRVFFRQDSPHIHINPFNFTPEISRLKAQPLVYWIYLVFENIHKGWVF